mmetsp:Transcript_33278/g.96433  ORF Transcript_33278/g.96433 Transcript_33278/m.96433 type:complete len:393 (-) Transcript_33278:926-2104(-)
MDHEQGQDRLVHDGKPLCEGLRVVTAQGLRVADVAEHDGGALCQCFSVHRGVVETERVLHGVPELELLFPPLVVAATKGLGVNVVELHGFVALVKGVRAHRDQFRFGHVFMTLGAVVQLFQDSEKDLGGRIGHDDHAAPSEVCELMHEASSLSLDALSPVAHVNGHAHSGAFERQEGIAVVSGQGPSAAGNCGDSGARGLALSFGGFNTPFVVYHDFTRIRVFEKFLGPVLLHHLRLKGQGHGDSVEDIVEGEEEGVALGGKLPAKVLERQGPHKGVVYLDRRVHDLRVLIPQLGGALQVSFEVHDLPSRRRFLALGHGGIQLVICVDQVPLHVVQHVGAVCVGKYGAHEDKDRLHDLGPTYSLRVEPKARSLEETSKGNDENHQKVVDEGR